ncbi:Xylose operon regulatory protein [Anatilimnocola aggregata]|uniref:Xylose operon regulatory protein n=1 Tax=Anatilimnocola aggregata TaxID=2528021 RepID=A0A517Y8P2_9BACT|nr:substrate-binding domain-containing protein [Anatilimnocola aggregata]QDU26586.1 Xylose operon regulatory protein [Anatilimnocola aggregata]
MNQPLRVALKLDLRWPLKRHAHIFAGTQRYADEHGWESIIDEYADEHLSDASVKSPPFDGVIARVNAKLANGCRRLALPLVNVWFNSPAKDDFPGVFPDMTAVGRLRAEHLLSRGLRRFAVLTSEDDAEKVAAESFRTTIAAVDGKCLREKIPLDPSRTFAAWQRTEQRIEAWMERWQLPIGVSIASEEVGRMVIQICRHRGWRVPGDVAIIAGTNEDVLCDHPRPSLTSVEIGYERIGYQAARLLDEQMRSPNKRRGARNQPPRHMLVPPHGLIVRESTDFYAVDDEVVTQALRFIAANSHRHINVDDVARAAGLHPRTLQRRIRQVVDWPIADEIRRVRIERAKRELAESKRSMAEIARDVGFGDRKRMYDVFRREVGITPAAYRKQRRLESPF